MSAPKSKGGIWRCVIFGLLCLIPILLYALGSPGKVDLSLIASTVPVDKGLWEQSIVGQNIMSALGSESAATVDGASRQKEVPAATDAAPLIAAGNGIGVDEPPAEHVNDGLAAEKEPVVAIDGAGQVEAGKTDHTPFQIKQKNMGKERFSARIEEFLKTAPRSPPQPQHVCKDQGLAWSSNCPSWMWLTNYHGPEKTGRPAVFVDIGCNKGFSIASFYEQFAPGANVNKKSICKLHKELDTPKYFGVCRDCLEEPRFGTGNGLPPKAYCIDGSPYTHKRTKEIATRLQVGQPLAEGWKLFHHAMTNATGTITYEDCASEDCGIQRPGDKFRVKKRPKTVPAMTYDAFAQAQRIEWADLVKIDTEGEEPLIIQGMHESLKANKVGFLAFEVHGTGKGWYRAFDMRRLVDLLDAYGYTCYIDASAEFRIMLLTGCADRRFQQSYVYDPRNLEAPPYYGQICGVIPQWGNAICGLRDNAEIKEVLKKLNQGEKKPAKIRTGNCR